MDFSLAATDSGPLCTSVFYCGGNMFFTVGSCRIYVIMVIGADDSVIIIKYGGNAIYGATLARSPAPFGNINKHHVNVNCII